MSPKLHRNPPFRAEHLGSLLRTDKLLDVRHACEAGKEPESSLKEVEDHDVKEIVKTQLDLGFVSCRVLSQNGLEWPSSLGPWVAYDGVLT